MPPRSSRAFNSNGLGNVRVLVTPEIARRLGIVLFRPGPDAMPLFMQGRVLV